MRNCTQSVQNFQICIKAQILKIFQKFSDATNLHLLKFKGKLSMYESVMFLSEHPVYINGIIQKYKTIISSVFAYIIHIYTHYIIYIYANTDQMTFNMYQNTQYDCLVFLLYCIMILIIPYKTPLRSLTFYRFFFPM